MKKTHVEKKLDEVSLYVQQIESDRLKLWNEIVKLKVENEFFRQQLIKIEGKSLTSDRD